MIVNKKLDRFKQWAGERMGGEVKTDTTEQFKALEQEMEQRQQGMEKMQEAMTGYVKAVSKKTELDRKEKTLPVAYLGASMITHGEAFEHDSDFGQCLIAFGRNQQRIARTQESYITAATNSWLDSTERSLVQMKEYQAARKKLESRRLAYDTSLAKMQKAKREDFRVEEELRSQQAKYEEAEADVERRMFEIKDSEADSVDDLTAFLEAQLAYHDRCRELLLQLQNEWPAKSTLGRSQTVKPAPGIRSRSNTARSFLSNHSQQDDAPAERQSIKSSRISSSRYGDLPQADLDDGRVRPGLGRSTTYQHTPPIRRDMSPVALNRLSRVPSDSQMIQTTRSNLRPLDSGSHHDVFADESTSPQTPQSTGSQTPLGGRRPPPPPPPSRASKPGFGKPAPPPPPAKRSLMT